MTIKSIKTHIKIEVPNNYTQEQLTELQRAVDNIFKRSPVSSSTHLSSPSLSSLGSNDSARRKTSPLPFSVSNESLLELCAVSTVSKASSAAKVQKVITMPVEESLVEEVVNEQSAAVDELDEWNKLLEEAHQSEAQSVQSKDSLAEFEKFLKEIGANEIIIEQGANEASLADLEKLLDV